jgi:thioredoxin-like negative regulator of GroEL
VLGLNPAVWEATAATGWSVGMGAYFGNSEKEKVYEIGFRFGGDVPCGVSGCEVGQGQDSGSKAGEFFGNGAEIVVIVHDGAGEPVSSSAMVRLLREGSIPSGQGATSHGRVTFVVTSLGEFTVIVEPAGAATVQKDVSVRVAGRTQVDVYLTKGTGQPSAAAHTVALTAGAGGRPILAPKAQEAFEKGMKALSADKLRDAEKFVGEAARLAPGHPDVLYVQGVLYLKTRNWELAQATLEKATQIDPQHARAFAALGMALADQGKNEAAIGALNEAERLDAAGVGFEAEWALGRSFYATGKYEEALKSARLALEEAHGKAPEISLLVAQGLTAVGKYEEAEGVLRDFLREHGDRGEAAKARRWLEGLERMMREKGEEAKR